MDGGMLSQDEINALLSGMMSAEEPASEESPSVEDEFIDENLLTDVEKDAVGEVANISMGSSATTLFSLVNRKVNITTPVVTLARWKNVIEDYSRPCVFIQIHYTKGLDGNNILILKEKDVKIITDLMMGGDGTNIDGELGELHLSAISEAMNQMMGSSATSLSSMLGTMIDISPPESSLINISDFQNPEDISPFLSGTFVKIAFSMQIEDLVDSTIMQLYPIEFAKTLYSTFMGMAETITAAPEPEPEPVPEPIPEPQPQANMTPDYGGMPQMDMSQMGMPQMGMPQMGMPQMGMPMMGMPMMGMPQMDMSQMGMQMGMPMMGMPQQNINIQPAQFQSFSPDYSGIPGAENIGLIKDVPLEVTVELGRTQKRISDILDFAPGTIIELDKIAGEPVDVLVNGKLVAKGEVVVIEESFGVRVTDIIKD